MGQRHGDTNGIHTSYTQTHGHTHACKHTTLTHTHTHADTHTVVIHLKC